MKKIIVLFLIFVTIGTFAQDSKQLREMTLSEISGAKGIRSEKLKEMIVPHVAEEQIGLPLEKIDSTITNAFIQQALDSYFEFRTLRDLAEDTHYPIKKLGSKLGLEISRSGYEKPLKEFGVSVQRVNRALSDYDAEENGFIWNVVATGMIIVFVALVLTGLIMWLFEYFHRLHNQRIRRKTGALTATVVGAAPHKEEHLSQRMKRRLSITARRIAAAEELDAYTVVAIATAIRLHEAALEEENRILATWTKGSASFWKTNRVMPNRIFFENRWGK